MEDQRIEDLARQTAKDVSELASHTGRLAAQEAVEVGQRAIAPTLLAATGGLFATAGLCGLLLSPAMNDPGRVRLLGVGYLLLGAVGVAIGVQGLTREARHALPRTRHAAKVAVDAVKDPETAASPTP